MATNTQYAELDRLILDRITAYDEPKQYNTIFLDGDVHRELERIADAIGDEPWRILDRRLQAMRRAPRRSPEFQEQAALIEWCRIPANIDRYPGLEGMRRPDFWGPCINLGWWRSRHHLD